MDLSGAFQTRIYTSDGSFIDPDDLPYDRTRYSYSNYFDLSGYSFQSQDSHQQIVDSQPAAADDPYLTTRQEAESDLAICRRRHPVVREVVGEDEGQERNINRLVDEIVEEQNERRASFITKQALLYWGVHLTSLVWNTISWTAYYAKKAIVGAYEGVLDTTYYFFYSSPVPYQASKVKLSVAGAPRVEWTYSKDTQLFVSSGYEGRSQHLPYLTAGIWHEGLLLYTITDFVEGCKYQGTAAPSPHHILSAWFLKTGVLLDPTLPFVLKVITEEGEEQELPLVGR